MSMAPLGPTGTPAAVALYAGMNQSLEPPPPPAPGSAPPPLPHLELPAGLPQVITIGSTVLVVDGSSIKQSSQFYNVSFTVDAPVTTTPAEGARFYNLQLFHLTLDSTAMTVSRELVFAAAARTRVRAAAGAAPGQRELCPARGVDDRRLPGRRAGRLLQTAAPARAVVPRQRRVHGDAMRSALALVALCGLAGAAHADRADQLFKKGQKLLAEKRYAEACAAFEDSDRLDPEIGAKLNIARCYQEWGKLATAWRWYSEAEQMASKAGDRGRRRSTPGSRSSTATCRA